MFLKTLYLYQNINFVDNSFRGLFLNLSERKSCQHNKLILMKRPFSMLLFVLFSFALLSCNENRIKELENELSSRQSELEEAENKIADIQQHIGDLESAVSSLRSEVDDFSYENWKYNIPDVEDATSNVESELESLKSVAD